MRELKTEFKELNPEETPSQNSFLIGTAFKSYSRFVSQLFKSEGDFREDVTHAVLGIGGEAGETVDLVKKSFANGRVLDGDKLVKELGDLMFYIQAMCNTINIPLQTIIQVNTDKLNKRFTTGQYSDAQAIARADEVKTDTALDNKLNKLEETYRLTEKALKSSVECDLKDWIENDWTIEQMLKYDYVELKPKDVDETLKEDFRTDFALTGETGTTGKADFSEDLIKPVQPPYIETFHGYRLTKLGESSRTFGTTLENLIMHYGIEKLTKSGWIEPYVSPKI